MSISSLVFASGELSTLISKNFSLEVMKACKKKYEDKNEGFWAGLTKSNLGVFSQVIEVAGNCVQELPVDVSSDKLDEFLRDTTNVLKAEQEKVILDEINKNSLYLNIESFLRYQYSFGQNPDLEIEKFKKDFLEDKKIKRKDKELFKKLFKEVHSKVKSENLKNLDVKETQDTLRSFGHSLNKLCENMRVRAEKEAKVRFSVSAVRRSQRNKTESPQEKKQRLLKPLIAKLKKQVQVEQAKLASINPMLNSLLYTKAMRKPIPLDNDFLGKCIDNDQDLPVNTKHIADMYTRGSRNELKNYIKNDLNDTKKGLHSHSINNKEKIKESLEEYLKYKPYLFGKYFRNIRDDEERKMFSKFICTKTLDIYDDDEFWNGASLIGGVAIGVGTGFLTMGMSTTAALLTGGALTVAEGATVFTVEKMTGDKIYRGSSIGRATNQISEETFNEQEEIASDRELVALMAAGSIFAGSITRAAGKILKPIKKGNTQRKPKSSDEYPTVTLKDLELPEHKAKIDEVRQYMIEKGHLTPGEDLTLERKKAIIAAHKVGHPEKGYTKLCPNREPDCIPEHNFEYEHLYDKIALLKGSGDEDLFPADVREFSLRAGITGSFKELEQKTAEVQDVARHTASDVDQVAKLEVERLKFFDTVKDRFRSLSCFKKKSCRDVIKSIQPGIKKLIEKYGEEGVIAAKSLLDFLKAKDFSKLSKAEVGLLKECLTPRGKSKIKCTSDSLGKVIKFLDGTKTSNDVFLTRLTRELSEMPHSNRFNDSIRLLHKQRKPGVPGKIEGDRPKITYINGKYYSDGQPLEIVRRNGKVRYYVNGVDQRINNLNGLVKEQEAIEKLRDVGLHVNVLPEDIAKHIEKGEKPTPTTVQFKNLRRQDGIETTRNPDLIIMEGDGKGFIADIYSPDSAASKGRVNGIVRGALEKTETKRQTNRVIIYIDEFDGSMKDISEAVRAQIAKENPKHMQEATILFTDPLTREPQLVPVWP